MTASRLPYKMISGLPRQAQVEIWRDFEELFRLIDSGGASGGLYNAFIDSEATADPENHVYPNLTSLIANEPTLNPSGTSHDSPADDAFIIGVVPRVTPVVETWTGTGSDNVVGRSVVMETLGWVADPITTGLLYRPKWDLAGVKLFMGSHAVDEQHGSSLTLRGLEVLNSGSNVTELIEFLPNGGPLVLDDCVARYTTDANPGAAKFTYLTDTALLYVFNSALVGARFGTRTVLVDTTVTLTAQATPLVLSENDFFWFGGSLEAANTQVGGDTLTLSGSDTIKVIRDVVYNAGLFGSTAGVTHTLSITNTGTNVIEFLKADQMIVSVASGAGHTTVTGAYRSATMTAPSTNGRTRRFVGSVAEASTWNGPGTYDIKSHTGTQLFSGSAVQARLHADHTSSTTGNGIVHITANDSLVVAVVQGGGKAYTIDAGALRSILVIAGVDDTTFGTASTNGNPTGANRTRVITHTADGVVSEDVSFSDPGSDYAATNVRDALQEVMDAVQAHAALGTDSHDASAISIVDSGGFYTATEVEGALQETADELDDHLTDAVDAHDASAISITDSGGFYASGDVEGALQEVATDLLAGTLIDSSTLTANSGTFTGTPTDSGLAVSWSSVNGRLYLVYAHTLMQSDTANDLGKAQITDSGGTVKNLNQVGLARANQGFGCDVIEIVSGDGSTISRKVQGVRQAGTGTLLFVAGGSFPSYMLVIDIGA